MAQWQLCSPTQFKFLPVLTLSPRKKQKKLPTLPPTMTMTRGARWSHTRCPRGGRGKGGPRQRRSGGVVPPWLRGSVVWPGVLREQRLRAAIRGLGGGRGQALHGLALLLLGLIVEQDTSCDQYGAHSRQAGDFVTENDDAEPDGQGVLYGAGNAAGEQGGQRGQGRLRQPPFV